MLKNHISLKKLVLCAFALCAGLMVNAQTRTIQGTVTGATGEVLTGVTVSVPGTTIGALTDSDGKYTINVPAEATSLQFSFIGLNPIVETIGDRTTINVIMEESTLSLDEIVVIGYGTVKKRDLTGSVTSVKSNEIAKSASSNAFQSIQGKVAGLDITRESGEAGSAINMTLRGIRSVNATNSPLFLVDGIEYGSTLDLNASDIASIEVLKDASSTAIYGTKGANGVVIITTKRGSTGAEKSTVSFNSYVSINTPTGIPAVMNAQQEYLFQAERLRYTQENTDDSWGSTNLADFAPEDVFSNVLSAPYEKTVLDLYNEGGVDWFDLIMKTGITQNYELSFTGGSEKTAFNLSLGYMDENGLLRNDNLKRYNTRVNLDHNISSRLKVGTSIQFTYRDWDRRQDGVYSQLIKMHSLAQPYLANGSILDKPSEMATSHTNPLLNEVDGYYSNNQLSTKVFGNIYGSWEILNGLQFKTVFGVNTSGIREGEYEDYMCTGNYQSGRGSFISSMSSQKMDYTLENTLNYAFNIGSKNEFQLLAGQAAQKSVLESHLISGNGLQLHYGPTSFYFLGNIPAAARALEDSYIKSTMLSYFGRVNYKLLGRYLFTATFRTDGSSVLAPGNKWDFFPSVAAAWVISDESFMQGVNEIDQLKIRASWGIAGNAAVPAYKTQTILGVDPVYYNFGTGASGLTTGYVPAIIGNQEVKWETTNTYDAGIDVTMFKERVSATLDFYFSRTSDLLLFKGLPPTSVYTQVLANVGETENKGFEASINLKVIQKSDFSWTSDIVYSMNRDKIISLASGQLKDVSVPDNALIVGEPVQAFYNYEADGCWNIDEATDALQYNKVPGDVKIVDMVAPEDSVINDLDKRLYNKSPKFIFGWSNTFAYKGFTLSAQLYGRVGQWISYDYYTAYKPTEADGSPALDFWTPENQDAIIPRPGIQSQNDLQAVGFVNASYLKLREVTLGYNLPVSLIEKAGLSSARIYGSLQNYFILSNLDNYDPERGGSISNPMSKQMVFGINLQF